MLYLLVAKQSKHCLSCLTFSLNANVSEVAYQHKWLGQNWTVWQMQTCLVRQNHVCYMDDHRRSKRWLIHWTCLRCGQNALIKTIFLAKWEFRMQVWNVLHAARWKCRTQKSQKNCHLRTIAQLCRAISSQLRHYQQSEKNMLRSNIFSICPHNKVNFGILAAEIVSVLVFAHQGDARVS